MSEHDINIEVDGKVMYITQGRSIIEVYNPKAFSKILADMVNKYSQSNFNNYGEITVNIQSEMIR